MRKLIFALLLGTLGTSCYSDDYAYRGTASAGYAAPMPDMAYVQPGVQVLVDYDEPVFYTSGYYWRYNQGYWYRSPSYTGGWAYASPPHALLRIDRPTTYVRYRPHGYVSRRPARVYRDHDARYYRERGYDRRRHDDRPRYR